MLIASTSSVKWSIALAIESGLLNGLKSALLIGALFLGECLGFRLIFFGCGSFAGVGFCVVIEIRGRVVLNTRASRATSLVSSILQPGPRKRLLPDSFVIGFGVSSTL